MKRLHDECGDGRQVQRLWLLVFKPLRLNRKRILTFFFFLGLHLQYMEVPRLGVKSELQLPAYTTVTATPAPSHYLRPTLQLAAMSDS